MAFGSGEDKSTGRVEETKVYDLQRKIEMISGMVMCLFWAAGAAVSAGVFFVHRAEGPYWFLVFPAVSLALLVEELRDLMPLNPSVQTSEIGITASASFQAKRFVHWSNIIGVVWIEKAVRSRGGTHWSYSLFLEVPRVGYTRSRIKLGVSAQSGAIGELRDEIIKRCGLKEVQRTPFRWHPLRCWLRGRKRQVWRREQFS